MLLSLRAYSTDVVAHRHGWHQLVVPLRGALTLAVRRRELTADPRVGTLVAAGELHEFAARPADRFLVADVPHAEVAAADPGVERWLDRAAREVAVPLDAATQELARAIARQLAARPSLATDGSLGAALLATLAAPLAAPAGAGRRVARALAYIDAHACGRLTAADVAAATGVGESQLFALFRRELGTTPRQAIAERRLREAERLLVETAMPIAEIALACGFADQTSLTRSLRRRRGITPGALRRGW